MTNDELLDKLNQHIDDILPVFKRKKVIERYRKTIDGFTNSNVVTDRDYQSNFIGFYRLRFPYADCYDHYFELLERSKGRQNISLAEALEELYSKTGRLESSFASKLLATLNPNLPIIDRIVLNNLGLRLPAYNIPNRKENVIAVYEELTTRLNKMLHDERFGAIKDRFMSAYPDYSFTDLKILDLLIWQLRK